MTDKTGVLTSNERKCYGCEHSIPWDWVFCAWCGWENDKPGAEKGPPAPETPAVDYVQFGWVPFHEKQRCDPASFVEREEDRTEIIEGWRWVPAYAAVDAARPELKASEQPKNWAVWQCLVHQRVFAAHAGCSYCREGRAPTHDCNGNALKSNSIQTTPIDPDYKSPSESEEEV